jgi:hypothetical protein
MAAAAVQSQIRYVQESYLYFPPPFGRLLRNKWLQSQSGIRKTNFDLESIRFAD